MMKNFPKISIIIPTYNIEKYIRYTIKSIIDQEYPNLELIIVDGKSTDSTVEIINSFKEHVTVLISEEDNGQYDAINKGFKYATGDIYAYINGDDIYFPWTFKMVAKIFSENNTVQWVSGLSCLMSEGGIIQGINFNTPSKPRRYIKNGWFCARYFGYLQQEGMFWSKRLWNLTGGLNLNYKVAADFNLWVEFAAFSDLVSVGIPLACFRSRQNSRSKVLAEEYLKEVNQISAGLSRPNFILRLLSINMITNRLGRKLTYKRGLTYKYYKLKNSWLMKKTVNSLSQHSLSSLFQELIY